MTFLDVLRGEALKLRTFRPLMITILVTIVLGLAYCIVSAKPADRLGLTTPDTAVVYAMSNLSFFAAIVGVLIASNEYGGGQLTTSTLAVPRRGRIFAAKILLSTAITTALGLLLAVFVATIGQAPLGNESVYATGQAGVLLGSLALAVASWTALGIISTCAAFVIRSPTVVLAVMIVASFGGGLFLIISGPIFQYLPTNAGVLMYTNHEQQFSDMLNPPDLGVPGATITVALWCVAAIAAAAPVFLRRDVGARQAQATAE